MYKIVRLADNSTVERSLTSDQAEKKIIFYDSEENPHVIQSEDSGLEFN